MTGTPQHMLLPSVTHECQRQGQKLVPVYSHACVCDGKLRIFMYVFEEQDCVCVHRQRLAVKLV